MRTVFVQIFLFRITAAYLIFFLDSTGSEGKFKATAQPTVAFYKPIDKSIF